MITKYTSVLPLDRIAQTELLRILVNIFLCKLHLLVLNSDQQPLELYRTNVSWYSY